MRALITEKLVKDLKAEDVEIRDTRCRGLVLRNLLLTKRPFTDWRSRLLRTLFSRINLPMQTRE